MVILVGLLINESRYCLEWGYSCSRYIHLDIIYTLTPYWSYTSFSCHNFKIHFDAIFTIYTLRHHIHQNIASSLSRIVITTNIEYTACTKMGIYNMEGWPKSLRYWRPQNLTCPFCHSHCKELHIFMYEPVLKPLHHNTSKNQCWNPNVKDTYKIRRSEALNELLN